jgi:tetratricopeptide (TPR) repeat protein
LHTMYGFVTDDSGRPVAGVKITLLNIWKPGSSPLETKTDEKGRWRRIGMSIGIWEISAEKEGYYRSRRTCEISAMDPANRFPTWTSSKSTTPIVPLILSRVPPLPEEDREARKILERAHDAAAERKYELAVDLFRQHRDRQPAYDMVTVSIGWCLQEMGDLKGSIAEFQALADKTSKNPQDAYLTGLAYAGIGECHWLGKDLRQSEAYFRKAVEASKLNAVWAYNLAELVNARGAVEEAIVDYGMAVQSDPGWSDPFYKLGLAHIKAGDKAKAAESFRAFLKIEPRSSRAREVRGILKDLEKKGLP